LDPAGGHLFSRRFGDGADQYGTSVAVDATGNVVLTGFSRGALDFGGGPLASAGLEDVLLGKFDASGKHLWSKRFGDAAIQVGYSVAVDNGSNTLLTGYFFGTVDFGNGPLVSVGTSDIFVAKFAP
jgi:hypothetical protein